MKYVNLKKTTAVVLSIGMVFSSSAVTGFAADNSKKIPTIPNSYINKVAEDIDNKYFYEFNRIQKHEKRNPNEIGFSSIRGGNIVGEHSVMFFNDNECFEVKHIASSIVSATKI